MEIKRIVLAFICSLLLGCNKSETSTQKEINQFIDNKKLDHVSIQKLNNSEYYIFSSPYIYIYQSSSDYIKSTGLIKEEVVIGGLKKGSIGLIINNVKVLRDAKTYTVKIDGKTREYDYGGEKYLIIKDYRIWNPTAQLKITFLNDENQKIFESDY
ncbi:MULTISPECIES: hypothetical protein [unclassified Paenibacillus]|uniref:hypothetical protein n=1 Tax=unclassified Paenibacillus TaxID=185978 RepID=UPI002404EBAC|nr:MULTISPECIES: hypothetical protein [unclassified Paenibacillus]MDF9840469.1 hypothetical protein [Paenibacillus sp. PastF-2]MDF9847051.1 hypothetical protein [Paenibacillus sp. PastM-2]MDF9853623.1 hypothetical protein [Paenibacillus sp. PastF-1]MDH6478891.1 hypothetical protein [Paenibacillus sp. PastH-2]MDH6506623.1 hypothetical protein [Paenibacillus sp. PastM-3]